MTPSLGIEPGPHWWEASDTLLNEVLVLEKRALSLIHFAQAREHAILLSLKANFYR